MIRHDVVEELKWSSNKINGILLTGNVSPHPKWVFAWKDIDGTITSSHITQTLEVYNTRYLPGECHLQYIPFPKRMTLTQFKECHIHKLFISDFIKEHTGEHIA